MANPYDEVVGGILAGKKAADNPYDDTVREILQNEAAVMRQAAQATPQQHAEAVAAARTLGTTPQVVLANPQEAPALAKEAARAQTVNQYPELAPFAFKNPTIAGIIQNDLRTLGEVAGSTLFTAKPTAADFPLTRERGFAKASQQLSEAQAAWDAGQQAYVDYAARMPPPVDDRGPIERGFQNILAAAPAFEEGMYGVLQAGAAVLAPAMDWSAGTLLPENPLRAVEAGFSKLRQDVGGIKQSLAGDTSGMGPVERGIYSGLQSAGVQIPGLMLSLATGNPAYAIGLAGAVTGGQSYGNAVDKGLSNNRALIYGLTDAAIEIGTEYLPMEKLFKDVAVGAPFWKTLMHQVATEVPGEQVATLLQDFNEWATLNPTKPFSDYVAARPDAAIETLVATIVGVGAHSGAVHLVSMATKPEGMADLAAREQAAQQQRQVLRAIQHGQQLKEAATAIAKTEAAGLGQEGKDAIAQVLNQSGPDATVTISARALDETLKSGERPVSVESIASPAIREQYATALATGGDIVIPTGEFLATFAQSPLLDPLLEQVRVNGNEMSIAEVRQWIDSGGAEALRTETEQRVLAEKHGDAQFNASRDRVKQAAIENLNASNRFTPSVNEAYATLIASHYAVRAAQLGITPEEMAAKHQLRVQAQPVMGGDVYEQASRVDQQIEQWAKGELPVGHVIDLGKPSKTLSAFVPGDLPIHLAKRILDKATDARHRINPSDLKGLHGALRNPIAVFASKKGDSHRVVVTELQHEDGNVVAVLELNKRRDEIEVHDIRSLHPKRDTSVSNWLEDGLLLGYEKTKGREWLDRIAGSNSLRGQTNAALATVTVYENEPPDNNWGADPDVMLQGQAGENERDLIITHNLTAANLLHAVKMGGIAVPSLAVTSKDNPLAGFGEITLIGDKALADPKGYARTKVFGADIYSPRYPTVTYQFTPNMRKRAEAQLKDGMVATDTPYLDWSEIEKGPRELQRTAPFIWHFLVDRGIAPEIKRTQVTPLPPELAAFANDTRHKFDLRQDPAFVEAAWQAHMAMLTQAYEGDVDAARAEMQADRARAEERGRSQIVSSYADMLGRYQRDLRDNGKVDTQATRNAMENQVREAGFAGDLEVAATEFFNNIGPNERIFQGFTNAGYRKYIPHTLENVVKILKKDLRGGESFHYGVGSLRAKFAPQFKSVEQIRKAKDRLISKADMEKVKEDIDAEFWAAAHAINSDLSSQTTIAIMEDAAKMGVKRAAKEYGYEVSDEAAVQVAEFLTRLRELPTEYFEAKILREVDLAEFAGAVVPEGVDPKVIDALQARGVKDIRTYKKGDEADRAAKIAAFENAFFQSNRGQIAFPENLAKSPSVITLLKSADLSTFLHEGGHFFFESDIALASELMAKDARTPGEQQIVDDVSGLLTWHGIQGTPQEQVAQWYGMDLEERRAYHERTAESFERYLMSGEAPSIELQPYFQRFRAWLLNVYKSIKDFLARNPEAGKLNDEVRAVFDRMLATTEQIKLAQQARSMMPLFESAQQAGMTPEEFAAYQSLGTDASNEAIQELQAKGLRDMQWTRNARSKELRRLQRLAKERRREVKMAARQQIMSQAVYRAWKFLTNKITDEDKVEPIERRKSVPGAVDPTVDSLFTAIAKLGGIDREAVQAEWGVDPKDKSPMPLFGQYVLRKENGLTIDAMAERLSQYGYLELDRNGKWDLHDFEDRFMASMRGEDVYSNAVDDRVLDNRRDGDQLTNLEALGAGRLSLGELRAEGVAREAIDRLVSLRMTSHNGLHPDLVAEIVGGFTSGDEMIQALVSAEPPSLAIESLTDQMMLEQYGELATPEALEKAADAAVHNEVRARMIATEANAMARAIGKPKVLREAAKNLAQAIIARLKIRDIRPGRFSQAQVRAAKAAAAAFRDGDTEQAATEKRNELINHYAARGAYDALDEVEHGVRYLRKFDNAAARKGLDPDYVDQIDALLERFDLRAASNRALDKRKSLAQWLTAQREAGMEPQIPAELENEAFHKSYREMTLEEFRGLVETVQQIEHLGRLKNRLLTAQDQRTYEAARDEMVNSIIANAGEREANTRTATTNLGRALDGLRRFWAAHIKAATYARIFDGGKDGPVWEYLIRPANTRADWETTRRAQATQKLTEILAPVFKGGRMGGKGKFFPSIGRSLNRESILAVALNLGNAGNMQRLLGGEGWTPRQIEPVLQSLTADEWRAVQQVWDYFEGFRPEIAAKERRVYGREPAWVEPQPLTVQTSDGQSITLRGGYYPIKYDPQASQRAEEHADAEDARRQLQGAYTSATTRRSFTKARVEEVSGRPLLYTLAGLYSGVNDVIHDLAWHEWLIDANRFMRSHTLDAAIREHYGPQAKAQLKNWVAAVAEGERGAANAGEAALGWLRQGVSAAGLGFNVTSAAMQVLGFNQSIVRVGPGWIGRGIARYIAHPFQAARDVMAASEFMANRTRTRMRELAELRNKVQDETAVKAAIKGGAYYLMMRMQLLVDVPTWLGAYEKAIAGGNDEARAIALADQAVIDSQGGGQLKDLSAIERGGPALKLFTVFYSYMNTAFNLGVETAMTEKSKAKMAAKYLMLYSMPAVLGYFLKQALTPGGGDDDDETLARKLIAEQLSYLMQLMVVVREFGEAAKIVAGAEGPRDYSGPAGVRAIADALKFGKQAQQGEFDDAFRKAAINLIGDLSGLPAAQVNRTITGIEALDEGKTENPAAVLFGYQKK